MSQPTGADPRLVEVRATAPARGNGFYLTAMFLGSFGVHVAIMSPIYVSLQLKAQEIAGTSAAGVIAPALSIGALGALIVNPIAGALSDRTRTRWGRRRPWLVLGSLALIGALVWIALAGTTSELTLGWLLAQVAANATLAPFMASFADNVDQRRRGRASSVLWLSNNVSILAGTYLSVYLVANLPVLFIAPGVLGLLLMLLYARVATDELPAERPRRLTPLSLLGFFWTNPTRHRDFALAWCSRLLIVLANFMFITYRLLYMQQRLGLDKTAATSAVAFGMLLYTVALLVGTVSTGWLSDRLRRRKVFVAGSTLLFGVGMIVLAHGTTLAPFYTAEVIFGFAYGVYLAIDQALVIDVLPRPEQPGKDLGVMNIAMALPQSMAPVVALALLRVGSENTTNYPLMLWGAAAVCVLGALVVLPIKAVR